MKQVVDSGCGSSSVVLYVTALKKMSNLFHDAKKKFEGFIVVFLLTSQVCVDFHNLYSNSYSLRRLQYVV